MSSATRKPRVTVTFSRQEMDDNDGDTSWLTQDYADVADPEERQRYKDQDAARLKAYRAGDWHFIGIRAKALIRVDRYSGKTLNYTVFHEMTSPGLWGIESDSGADYLEEVYKEECAMLRADIVAMKDAEFK